MLVLVLDSMKEEFGEEEKDHIYTSCSVFRLLSDLVTYRLKAWHE